MLNNNRKQEILREFIREVWNEGLVDRIDAYLAPSYTIRHDPGDPWEGQTLDPEGFKQRVRISRAPFPDQRFEIQEIFADDDKVAITWLWAGAHLGDMPGFPATGKVIRMSGATVYYFDGERLSGHWQITDRLGVYQQLRQSTQ
jgi:steroid delta-isomerase-like uncharacterized protein